MNTKLCKICFVAVILVIQTGIALSQNTKPAYPDRTEAETKKANALPPILAGTSILIRVDPAKIKIPKVPEEAKKDSNSALQFEQLESNLEELKKQIGAQPFFVLIDLPHSPGQSFIRLEFQTRDSVAKTKLAEFLSRYEIRSRLDREGWLTASIGNINSYGLNLGGYIRNMSDKELSAMAASNQLIETFDAGLAMVPNQPIQIVVVPPDYLWRTYEEMMTELPDQLGGGSVKRLTHGLRWMAVGVDPQKISGSAVIQSASPAAATEFAPFAPILLEKVVALFVQSSEPNLRLLEPLASRIESEVVGDQIRYSLQPSADSEQLGGELVKYFDRLFGFSRDLEIAPKLRQLAIAVHNYESAFGVLPPAAKSRNADGTSGLSWRVHVLPFLGETELYNQFKLDEPWDSPTNKPLLAKMPSIFRTRPLPLKPAATDLPEGYTTLVAPVGKGTIFGGTEVVTMGKIIDGTSNTILFVEVKPELAVPWTAPQDYSFDPENPASGLKPDQTGKFNAALGDGSVQQIRLDLPAKRVLHLFQMNDGNIVEF